MTTEEVMQATYASARQLQWWDEEGTIEVKIEGNKRQWREEDVYDVKFLLYASGPQFVKQLHKKALKAWRLAGRPVRCTMVAELNKKVEDMSAWDFKIYYTPLDLVEGLRQNFGRKLWVMFMPESLRNLAVPSMRPVEERDV